MLICASLCVVLGGPLWETEPISSVPVSGITSPTGLLLVGPTGLMCSDRLDNVPGIFEFDWTADHPRARLLIPRAESYLTDLLISPDGSAFLLATTLNLKVERRETLLYQIDRTNSTTLTGQKLDWTFYCPEGEPCALEAAVFNGETVLGATRGNPSTLLEFRPQPDGGYAATRRRYVSFPRRQSQISDMTIANGELLLLLREQWSIVAVRLEDIEADGSAVVDPRPVISLRNLAERFSTIESARSNQGLSECFAFAPNGDLILLASNHGYRYRDQALENAPYLLRFKFRQGREFP